MFCVSQASKHANNNWFSLRFDSSARNLNRLRKSAGTLNASCSVSADREHGCTAAFAVRCVASGKGLATWSVIELKSTAGRLVLIGKNSHFLYFLQELFEFLPQRGNFLRGYSFGFDFQCGFAVRKRFGVDHALVEARVE